MLAVRANFPAQVPPPCGVFTSPGFSIFEFEGAKSDVAGVLVLPSTQVELAALVTAFPFLSFFSVKLELVLTTWLCRIGGGDGELARGRDASVDGCREDGDRDLFCDLSADSDIA